MYIYAENNIETKSRIIILRLGVMLAHIVHHTFKGMKCYIYFLTDLFPFAIIRHPVIPLAKCELILTSSSVKLAKWIPNL